MPLFNLISQSNNITYNKYSFLIKRDNFKVYEIF